MSALAIRSHYAIYGGTLVSSAVCVVIFQDRLVLLVSQVTTGRKAFRVSVVSLATQEDNDGVVNDGTRVPKVQVPVRSEFNVKQVTWASLVHQHQLGCRVNVDMPAVVLDNLARPVHRVALASLE